MRHRAPSVGSSPLHHCGEPKTAASSLSSSNSTSTATYPSSRRSSLELDSPRAQDAVTCPNLATTTPLEAPEASTRDELSLSLPSSSSSSSSSSADTSSSLSSSSSIEEPATSGINLDNVLTEVENAPVIETGNVVAIPFSKENIWRKTVEFLPIASSVSLAYMVNMMNSLILLTFVGRLGDIEGAAAGLSNFYIAVTGVAFCTGLLGAEDTLCSQAFGAGNLKRVSIVFQRSLAVMLLVCFPVGVLWCLTTPLLIALRQDPTVSKLAGHFVLIYLPSLPALLFVDSLRRYLVCQGIAAPTLWAVLVANVLSAIAGFVMVLHTPLKFYGMPIAICLANFMSLLFLGVWVYYKELYKPTWKSISLRELLDWRENWQFIKLGVPGALMLCAEWIGFEIHGLMAGWIGISALAAQSILLNTNYLLFSFPLGQAIATTVIVGNAMGSGRYREAFFSYVVAMMDIEVIALLISIMLFALHNVWGYIFTNVPAVIDQVARALPAMAFFICSDAAGGVGGGAIRGVGQQTKAAICNLIAFYGIGVPLGYYLAFPIGLNWGLPGLWTGLAAASYTAAFLLHCILILGDWKKWSLTAQKLAAEEYNHISNDDDDVEMNCRSSSIGDHNISGSSSSSSIGNSDTGSTRGNMIRGTVSEDHDDEQQLQLELQSFDTSPDCSPSPFDKELALGLNHKED